MPRKPRYFLPNVPVHMIIRGNNKKVVFVDEEDYVFYLTCLKESCLMNECEIHAYVLMTNHIHLLVSAVIPSNLSKFAQHLGRKYVPYYNHKYNCTGTLWEGRFKASSIESERYLLTCSRYIELNPVRASMVEKPDEYRWSSYLATAHAKYDPIITYHDIYLSLGASPKQRARRYRAIFKEVMVDSIISEIRASVQTGTPMGDNRFKAEIESILKVKVGQSYRGRPKPSKKESQQHLVAIKSHTKQ